MYQKNNSAISTLDREALKSLGVGFVVFIGVVLVPFISYIFYYIIILVHEFGHAVFGWLFGYFSIPAFDFTYGGGITIHQEQNSFILIVVYAIFGWLLFTLRRNKKSFLILLSIVGLYTMAAFSSMHQVVILFMGHGAELFFGGIFLYRALSGSSILVKIERPLYAFLAFFIFYKDIRFGYDLLYSPVFRAEYAAAKGGGHWMDFSRIAREYLQVELTTVAAVFLLFCLLVPLLSYLCFRHRSRLVDLWKKLILL